METQSQFNFNAKRRRDASLGLVVSCCVLVATCFLAQNTPLTWDEGDAFYRAESVERWFGALTQGTNSNSQTSSDDPYAAVVSSYLAQFEPKSRLFSREALAVGFPHTIYREGHPAGYSLVIASGRFLTSPFDSVLSEKIRFRFGVLLLFSIALGAVYYRVARSYGFFGGVAAVSFIALCPRVLGHALLAGGDSILVSSWLLAWSTFDCATRSKRGSILWGLALGLSFSAKFSGFILPLPFLFIAFFEIVKNRREGVLRAKNRRLVTNVVLGIFVGLLFFLAVNPTLWRAPFSGLVTFWNLNTQRVGFDIPILFNGKFCTPKNPLPWWNGFFQVGVTTPVFFLFFDAFVLFDLTQTRNENEPRATFRRSFNVALASGLVLPIIRAFPGVPVHDGARLLIASCPFWAILASVGVVRFIDWTRKFSKPYFYAATCFCCLWFGLTCENLARFFPNYFSYYNVTIGGLSGAVKRGYEPTYYWDSFDVGVVERLNQEITRARAEGRPTGVLFGSFSQQTLDFYKRWNVLDSEVLTTISEPNALNNRSRYGFYVLQRRPSGLTALDFELMKSARPIFRKKKSDSWETNLFNFAADKKNSVVLLEVYDYRDVEKILTRNLPNQDAPQTQEQ